MTIYLTEQSLSLALRAIHRREVAATVREAQGVINRAARAHRANAPQAGADGYEPAEQTMADIERERTKLVFAVLAVCVVVAVLGAIALIRWRAGVTW